MCIQMCELYHARGFRSPRSCFSLQNERLLVSLCCRKSNVRDESPSRVCLNRRKCQTQSSLCGSDSASSRPPRPLPLLRLLNQMVRPNECLTMSDEAFNMNSVLMMMMVMMRFLWTGTMWEFVLLSAVFI